MAGARALSLPTVGLTKGETVIPFPHVHPFHPTFDAAQDSILEFWNWVRVPLVAEDDD